MELTNNRDDLSALAGEESESGKEKSAVNDSRYPTEISPPGKSNIHSLQPLKISLWLIQKPKLSQLVSYLSCTIKL